MAPPPNTSEIPDIAPGTAPSHRSQRPFDSFRISFPDAGPNTVQGAGFFEDFALKILADLPISHGLPMAIKP
jgi:hypothetical protein